MDHLGSVDVTSLGLGIGSLVIILLAVTHNMSEWHSLVKTLRSPRSHVAVMVVTFTLTVILDSTAAIEGEVIHSAMLFIRRMAEVSQVTPLTKDLREGEESEDEGAPPVFVPEGVEVFEVFGTLFVGAVEQCTETTRALEKHPGVFILETRSLLAIDDTGIRPLEDLLGRLMGSGARLILSGIHKQPLSTITQAGVLERIGEDNLCGTLAEGLERARVIITS